MVNPKKEWNRSDNLNRLLSSLKQHDELSFGDLKEKVRVSEPTLTEYIKALEKQGRIEHFFKARDRRKRWYRIKPENRQKVEAQLLKYEAIKFIESIHNPVYVFRQKDGKAIAAFMSDPGNVALRDVAKKAMQNQVSAALNFPNLLKFSPAENQKIAVVIMAGKEGVKP